MNFIKKIFEGEKDKDAHLQFQKFSKGEFQNRALIEVKNSKDKSTIKTSPEFANELVKIMAEKLINKGGNVRVTGCIVSTLDLKDEIEFKEIKQFQGVKRYLIDKEMSGQEIKELIKKLPKNFFGLSFSVNADNQLKIKPKAPKSGKPGKKSEEPKADFCSLKTSDLEIAKNFIFERPKLDFKDAKINHTYLIEEIIIPEEIKKEGDFKKMREEAIRKGKIIRKVNIDGKESISEKEFEA